MALCDSETANVCLFDRRRFPSIKDRGRGTMPDCTDNKRRRLRRSRLLARSAIIVTILACVFLPEVVSLVWHLVHGKTARFHEWEVPVPWGWRAFSGQGMLIVQRIHRAYYRRGEFSEVIVAPLISPPNHAFEYEKWKPATIRVKLKGGYDFVAEHRIHLGGQEGYGLSFAASQNPDRLRVTCVVPNHRLAIDFIGDPTYAPVFDSITRHITGSNSHAPSESPTTAPKTR